ncbi:MAG: hypothetical protein V9G20_11810 [Candidatus Promineifilaceae bacterium]
MRPTPPVPPLPIVTIEHSCYSTHLKHTLWQIARTIYQIVLQIFIPLGVHSLMGNSSENSR